MRPRRARFTRRLDFLGNNITFVSEKQLAEGKIPDVPAIVLPHTTHVTNAAAAALTKFQSNGGAWLRPAIIAWDLTSTIARVRAL